MPRRTLLGIGAGVMVLHLLALQGASSAIQASQRLLGKHFVMRNVVLSTVAEAKPKAQVIPSPVPATDAPPIASARQPVTPSAVPSVEMPAATSVPVAATGSLLPPDPNGQRPGAGAALPEFTPEKAPAPLPTALAPATTEEVVARGATPVAEAVSVATPPPDPGAVATPSAGKLATPPQAEIEFIVPRPTRLKYDVMGRKDSLSYSARAELLWLHDGKNYDARLEVSAFLIGSRIRTSTGSLMSEGLEPLRFADRFRTEVAAHFVKSRKIVTFSANTPETDWVPGMQDQLSVFMQIGGMLAAAPLKYPTGTTLTFETVGPRSQETWVFGVEAEETLNLPGGEVKAIKLVRAPRLQYDQTAELWLAPQVGYLPVRIKITERNGDFVDQQWRSTEAP